MIVFVAVTFACHITQMHIKRCHTNKIKPPRSSSPATCSVCLYIGTMRSLQFTPRLEISTDQVPINAHGDCEPNANIHTPAQSNGLVFHNWPSITNTVLAKLFSSNFDLLLAVSVIWLDVTCHRQSHFVNSFN